MFIMAFPPGFLYDYRMFLEMKKPFQASGALAMTTNRVLQQMVFIRLFLELRLQI